MPKFRLHGKVAPQSCVLENGVHDSRGKGKGPGRLGASGCCGSASSVVDAEREAAPRHSCYVGNSRRLPDEVHWKRRVCESRVD